MKVGGEKRQRKPFLAEGTASVAGGSTVNMSNGRTPCRGNSKSKENSMDRPSPRSKREGGGERGENGKKREKLTLTAWKMHSLR